MKMDLRGLCKQLAQAKEEETVPTGGRNAYLLEQILYPLIRRKTVLLRDIDFSKFEAEDLRWLADYYESLEMQGRKLSELVGVIAGIEPVACKARRFC